MDIKTLTAVSLAVLIGACSLQNANTESATPAPRTEIQSPGTPVQPPEVVVATMNRLYNDTANNCREIGSNEPRGHYYCSGLLIRGVSDGDYPPWSHSPGAVRLGASSYSWIRHDMIGATVFTASGFILRNPAYGAQNQLPAIDVGFICLYPLDNRTSSTTVPHKGCGLRAATAQAFHPQPEARHHNAADAWGSCEAINIRTAAQWNEFYRFHFTGFPSFNYDQCSWNVDSQSGWINAISSFNTNTDYYRHNELMLNIIDDGSVLKKYIGAFFYIPDIATQPEAREEARRFQIKLNANGYTVPVLRLDFTAPAAQRLSYRPEDQAIAQ